MDKTERKEIPFPASGKMWAKYSGNLAKALCDYLTSQGETWDSLELKRYGIIQLPCTLENKINLLQIIHIERTRYICETVVSLPLGEEGTHLVEHYIKEVEEINAALEHGTFSVDKDFGKIMLMTTLEPDGQVTMEQLAEFVEYPKKVIGRHADLF